MRRPQHMKISELSFHADVPAHTIRYYLREGLIPEPIRTNRNMAYYTEDHLARLKNIREMRESGLSLKEIKAGMKQIRGEVSSLPEPGAVYSSRRTKIVQSAIDLFRKKGFENTSVSEIVDHAGVGKGTFYQHFTEKEELFFECADSVFENIDRELAVLDDISDPMERLWNRGIFFARSYRHMIGMLNIVRAASVKDNPRFRDKYEQVMLNLVGPIREDIQKAFEAGTIRLGDKSLVANMLMGAVEYCFYFNERYGLDTDELVLRAWEIVFRGITEGARES